MAQVVRGERMIVEWRYASQRRDPSELSYEVAFLGACMGVALSRLGSGRDHKLVTFTFLVEDDGQWLVLTQGATSSFWLPDLMEQLEAAQKWLEVNAVKTRYGWEFK